MVDVSEDTLHLDVCSLSGKEAALSSRLSASPEELCAQIEELLGIPACSQQWLVESTELLFQDASTLAAAGLKTGDRLTVMHSGFAPLEPLPQEFRLDLTSARQRIRTGCSSAFTLLYKFSGSFPGGWLYLEPWRKKRP